MKLNTYLKQTIDLREQAELQAKVDSKLRSIFTGLPFYCLWSYGKECQDKCFNHIIGMPQKEGKEYPLFDYEHNIIKTLEDNTDPSDIKHKHLWIKKSTGLGISELILRYIAYLCLRDNRLSHSQICLVTGPRIELAISLMDRLKGLFSKNNIITEFNTKPTVLLIM